METGKRLTLQGRELKLGDIENVKSPALKEILKQQFFQQLDESREGYDQEAPGKKCHPCVPLLGL